MMHHDHSQTFGRKACAHKLCPQKVGAGTPTQTKWITAHKGTDVVSKEDLIPTEENDRLRRENRIRMTESENLKEATV